MNSYRQKERSKEIKIPATVIRIFSKHESVSLKIKLTGKKL